MPRTRHASRWCPASVATLMFGIGTGELLLLLVLALLVLGPERMPRLARDIGKTVGDLRRTSDDLRQEFLNADSVIDRAAKLGEPESRAPAAVAEPAPLPGAAATETLSAEPAGPASEEAGATQADVAVPDPEGGAEAEPDPDETAFDREAREARRRLDDPARAERAKAEGWTVPSDEAGTNTDRWS